MSNARKIIGAVALACSLAAPIATVAHAQTANTDTRAADTTDRGQRDWGWLGLIGLVGLAGLLKSPRDDRLGTRSPTTATR